jgi:hypothetical protein
MFGKNASNKGAEATGKRTSPKKVKMKKNMRYAISAAICVLFIATAFSGAVGETVNVNKNWDLDHWAVNEGYKEVNGNNRASLQSSNKYIWSDKGDNLDNWAITPTINLSGIATAELKFLTQYEILPSHWHHWDYGYVKVSSDGGDTWTTLATLHGSQPDWIEMEFDLSPWAGEIILIAFEYSTGPGSISEGWYVDSIIVEREGVVPYPPAVLYSEDFEGYEVGDHWGDWIIVEKAPIEIVVKYITIGTGSPCFSFAIFADPQSDTTSLASAVSEINGRISMDDIRFVIVDGDLIQGEKGTANEYLGQFDAIKNELDQLNVNVPYIPIIGNHDVWCNLYTTPILFPDSSGSIPPYLDYPGGTGQAPEQIFDTVFGPVYTSLADTLAGWTKQDSGMPFTNPIAGYPPTYFQNFVFDYGDYHFICSDYCARDDFKPTDWTIIVNGNPVDITKFQFGYARIQNAYGNDGTIKWVEDHLEKYGYCDPNRYDRGYKRSKNIILISHHAPISNLKGNGTYDPTIGPMPITWELQNENTYGFNQNEYNNLVSRLNLLSAHDFNYRWFTGHYERKGMEWTDTQITPNTPVKVIASVQPLTWVPNIPGLVIDPTITINNVHSVTTEDNLNGQITIVKVLQPGGTNPDPSIYSQLYTINHPADPASPPPPVTWDSPDIELYDQSGSFVPSGNLNWGEKYEIRARIYNKGCSDANIKVRFKWSKAALNWVDQETGFTAGNVIGPITIPSGEERVVRMQYWDASIVAPGPGQTTIHACVRAVIEPQNMDSNSNNNYGTENCDVHNCQTSASDEVIDFSFPIRNPANITNGITVDVYPGVGTLWNPEIVLPELAPGEEGNVTLRLYPIPGVARNVGDSEIFSLTARRLDTNETTGGLEVTVVVDDSPILDWTGDIGYQIDGVEPDEGNAGDTFTFRVKYKDENNHAPASGYPLLYLFKGDEQIEGSPFVMNEEDPTDTVYTDGKIYIYSVTLSEPGDDYTHFFWARDSLGIAAEGPAVNVTSGPLVKLPVRKIVDQSCLQYLGEHQIQAHSPFGQEFTPLLNSLAGIDVWLATMNSRYGDDTITVNIREGYITGTILATVSDTVTVGFSGLKHFNFPTAIPVTPGNVYVVELLATKPTFGWWYCAPGAYERGRAIKSGMPSPEIDCVFQTYAPIFCTQKYVVTSYREEQVDDGVFKFDYYLFPFPPWCPGPIEGDEPPFTTFTKRLIDIEDFDWDLDLDFLTMDLYLSPAGRVDAYFHLFINDGGLNFVKKDVGLIRDLPLGWQSGNTGLASADFTGDFYPDFMATIPRDGEYKNEIYLFENTGGNTFAVPVLVDVADWARHARDMDAGDFDEDGNYDFVIFDYPWGGAQVPGREFNVYLYRGTGVGTFWTPQYLFTPPNSIGMIVTGDFGGYGGPGSPADGHLDIIVGQDDDGDPGQTWVYFGNGLGGFSGPYEAYDLNPADELGYDKPGAGTADAFDLDGDSNLDIVATGGTLDPLVSILYFVKGNGDGTFQGPQVKYGGNIKGVGSAVATPPVWFGAKFMAVNETMYKNSITQRINVSKIRYKFKVVDEEWAAKWTNEILYVQKETKYSIAVYLNKTGYVTRVDFERWGFPITEIPYELAKQSLASLPPGFAIDP